jgi:hypothetical protein
VTREPIILTGPRATSGVPRHWPDRDHAPRTPATRVAELEAEVALLRSSESLKLANALAELERLTAACRAANAETDAVNARADRLARRLKASVRAREAAEAELDVLRGAIDAATLTLHRARQ